MDEGCGQSIPASAAASSSPFPLQGALWGLPGLGSPRFLPPGQVLSFLEHIWDWLCPAQGSLRLPSQSPGHTQPFPWNLPSGLGLGFFFSVLVSLFIVNAIVLKIHLHVLCYLTFFQFVFKELF